MEFPSQLLMIEDEEPSAEPRKSFLSWSVADVRIAPDADMAMAILKSLTYAGSSDLRLRVNCDGLHLAASSHLAGRRVPVIAARWTFVAGKARLDAYSREPNYVD